MSRDSALEYRQRCDYKVVVLYDTETRKIDYWLLTRISTVPKPGTSSSVM